MSTTDKAAADRTASVEDDCFREPSPSELELVHFADDGDGTRCGLRWTGTLRAATDARMVTCARCAAVPDTDLASTMLRLMARGPVTAEIWPNGMVSVRSGSANPIVGQHDSLTSAALECLNGVLRWDPDSLRPKR